METAAATLASLPDDTLAAILALLPARSLAASRRVCTAWRGLVDERRLLLRHALPRSVRGLFINYVDHSMSHFFAGPACGRRISGEVSFLLGRWKHHTGYYVADHCNGLVLHILYPFHGKATMYVWNHAARWWARLPRQCSGHGRTFLVFDPAVSPHYQVLWTHHEPKNPKDNMFIRRKKLLAGLEPTAEEEEEEYNSWRLTEWPPSRWAWQVFSSRTGQWEERVFVREGEAAGTLGDLLRELVYMLQRRWRYAAYWQGALYIHCRGEYVARLSLSNNSYQVIKSPIDLAECNKRVLSFLGKSEKGVYFGTITNDCQLQVWVLNESRHQMQWVSMHQSGLNPHAWEDRYEEQKHGPWIFDDEYSDKKMKNRRLPPSKRSVEWNSDDDDIIDTSGAADVGMSEVIHFLGFHPYKEVVFLCWQFIGVAYHLGTSKTQYLGMLRPSDWNQGVDESFVYTPCMIRHEKSAGY